MDCRSQLSRFRCLVIERHQLYAHFIRRALYNLGINTVRIEASLSAALKALDRSQYDLIIADWELKDKDTGLSLIQSLPEKQRDMFSIIYTCNDQSRSQLSAAMSEGPEELILHPISMNVLKNHIIRGCQNYLETLGIRRLLNERDMDMAMVHCEDLMDRDDLVGYWASRKLTEIYRHFSNFKSVERISRAFLQKRNAEWVRIALINALHEQESHDEALIEAKEYVDSCVYSAQPHQLLGKSHYLLGEKDRALSAYEKARRLDPRDFNTLMSCASISMELGMHEKSITIYKRALQVAASSKNETPELYIKLVNVIQKRGDDSPMLPFSSNIKSPLEDACDIIVQGARRFPQDPMIQIYRAILTSKREDMKGNRNAARMILSSTLYSCEPFMHRNLGAASDFLLAMNAIGNYKQSRDLIHRLELSGPLEELSDVKKEIAIIEADYNAARSSANHNMTINKRNLSPQNPQRISTRTQYAA